MFKSNWTKKRTFLHICRVGGQRDLVLIQHLIADGEGIEQLIQLDNFWFNVTILACKS